MCTYQTEKLTVTGSAKGPSSPSSARKGPSWFKVTDVTVYLDHPQHAPVEHSLNVDFLNPQQGPSARVAVELTAGSARALAEAILSTLDAAPAGLIA